MQLSPTFNNWTLQSMFKCVVYNLNTLTQQSGKRFNESSLSLAYVWMIAWDSFNSHGEGKIHVFSFWRSRRHFYTNTHSTITNSASRICPWRLSFNLFHLQPQKEFSQAKVSDYGWMTIQRLPGRKDAFSTRQWDVRVCPVSWVKEFRALERDQNPPVWLETSLSS